MNPGEIYSFKTRPITEFGPPETGRYAALKIIGRRDGQICLVTLEVIFDEQPTLSDVARLPYLENNRFQFTGRPACFFVISDWECDLAELRLLGEMDVATDEEALMASCQVFGSWETARIDAEGEWRWSNDQAALKREIKIKEQAQDAEREAKRIRYRQRQKNLT